MNLPGTPDDARRTARLLLDAQRVTEDRIDLESARVLYAQLYGKKGEAVLQMQLRAQAEADERALERLEAQVRAAMDPPPPIVVDTAARELVIAGEHRLRFGSAAGRWADVVKLARARERGPGPDAGFVMLRPGRAKQEKKAREDLRLAFEDRIPGVFKQMFESRRQIGIRFRLVPVLR